MRILLAFVVLTTFTAVASAQPALRQTLPDPANTSPPTRAERLDALFERLQTADNEAEGLSAEGEIIKLWHESGSDTVDLLMEWTLTAMDEENYPLALDFLDRITSLKPDYVEGWNKRATVHYLTDDYGKSLADLERTLALEPRHFGALAGLGTILRELGDEERALLAYKEAVALDPFIEDVQKAIDELAAETEGQNL